jgi:hypothetical protein
VWFSLLPDRISRNGDVGLVRARFFLMVVPSLDPLARARTFAIPFPEYPISRNILPDRGGERR